MSTSPPCFSISGENYCANNITLIYYSGVPDVNNTCTIETCSLLVANFKYLPNLTGNSIFVAIFTILFLISLPLGIIKKTWGYMAGLNIGIVLEVVGYGGRIMGHSDPFSFNAFLIYLILLTIGPAFLAAAIYLCLARIIVVYGAQYARFKPRTYSIVFMCSDFLALVLQGAGGGIASTASDNRTTAQAGVNIMIAGLAWQVVSLSAFAFAAADYAIALRRGRRRDGITGQFHALTETRRWTIFLWCKSSPILTIS